MAASLGSGSLKLTADTTGLIEGVSQGLAKAKEATANATAEMATTANDNTNSLIKGITLALSAAAGPIGAAAGMLLDVVSSVVGKAIGALTDGVSAMMKAFNASKDEIIDLQKTAQNLNLPIGELQGFHYAAAKSGADMHALNIGLRNLAETGEDAFKFADRIKDMPLIQQMQELQKLGRSGWQLRSMFAGGAEELRKVVDEGKQLTSALSDADAQAVRTASGMASKIKLITQGLWNQLVVTFAPIVEARLKGVLEFFKQLQPVLLAMIRSFGTLTSAIGQSFGEIFDYIRARLNEYGVNAQNSQTLIIVILRNVTLALAYMTEAVIAATGYIIKFFGGAIDLAGKLMVALAPIVDFFVNLGALTIAIGGYVTNFFVDAIRNSGLLAVAIASCTGNLASLGATAITSLATTAISLVPSFSNLLVTLYAMFQRFFGWLLDRFSTLATTVYALVSRLSLGPLTLLTALLQPTSAGAATREIGQGMQDASNDIKGLGDRLIEAFGKSAPIIKAFFDNLNLNIANSTDAARRMGDVWQSKYVAAGALIQGSKEALSVEAKFKTEGLLKSKPEDLARAQLAEQKGIRRDVQDVAAAVRENRIVFEVI